MKNKKILLGVVIVLLGVYMLCAQFIPNMPQIGVFKSLIAIGLIAISISNIPKIEFFGILTPLAIVFLMFKGEIAKLGGFDASNIKNFTVLAATVLCSIGLNMLFGDVRRKRKKIRTEKKVKEAFKYHSDNIVDGKGVFVDEESVEEYEESDDIDNKSNGKKGNEINCHLVFGSSTKYIESDDFNEANLDCCFGELVVYFDKAKVMRDRATINMEVVFGNMVLYLPKEWNVVINVDTCGGSIKECGKNVGTGPKVVLTGDVTFAGAEIHYI